MTSGAPWGHAESPPPKSNAEADRRRAVAKSREGVDDSQQLLLATEPTRPAPTPSPSRPPVILKLGPRDYSVLAYDRDEGGEPVYLVVKEKIKASSTAAVLVRKLEQETRSS